MPPFLVGPLPEGYRLTVLKDAVKTSPGDEFSLLLAVGADAPRDVRVVPVGEAPVEPGLLGERFDRVRDGDERERLPERAALAANSLPPELGQPVRDDGGDVVVGVRPRRS